MQSATESNWASTSNTVHEFHELGDAQIPRRLFLECLQSQFNLGKPKCHQQHFLKNKPESPADRKSLFLSKQRQMSDIAKILTASKMSFFCDNYVAKQWAWRNHRFRNDCCFNSICRPCQGLTASLRLQGTITWQGNLFASISAGGLHLPLPFLGEWTATDRKNRRRVKVKTKRSLFRSA